MKIINENINNINICTSVDRKYIKYLMVMINSVLINTNFSINFFILSREFCSKDKKKVKNLFTKNVKINIINMDSFFKEHKFLLPNHIMSKSAMDRLLITSILKDIKKVIYLDVDLIVNSDISNLYNFDTGETGICARICNPSNHNRILGLVKVWGNNDFNILKYFPGEVDINNDKCFNSGVMLLDLDKMRENNFEQKMLKMISKYPLADQFLLNLYTNGKHTELPISWNYFPVQDHDKKVDKNIIHWIGPDKPWNSHSTLSEYWYRYSYNNKKLPGTIWGITTFFNPAGYKNKKENYDKFRESSKKQGLKLVTVELEFGDYPFELNEDDADIVIHVRGKKENLLWQKEKLLNIGLKKIPKNCDKVVWIDCDIIFENDFWVKETSELLEKYAVVQPFSCIFNLPQKCVENTDLFVYGKGEGKKSYGSAYAITEDFFLKKHSEPGFVWSIRRDVLDKIGFYDKSVIGDGDVLMLYAFMNIPTFNSISSSTGFRDDYMKWSSLVSKYVGKKDIFYTEGSIYHMWHGNRKNRIYEDRRLIIKKNNYNPVTDIKEGDNGLWKWSSDKKDLHNGLKKYFSLRNEENSIMNSFSILFFKIRYKPVTLKAYINKKIKIVSFEWKKYIEANPDLKRRWNSPIKAFLHYLVWGRREGRSLYIKNKDN